MIDTKELKKIRIVDFCNENGIPLKKDSRDYYRLEEHDSLVINDKKNVFTWNSRNVSGDTIDFVKVYYDCNFKEAVSKLQNNEYELHDIERAKEVREPYKYDSSNEKIISKARSYLVDERKIAPGIVDKLIDHKLIREDKRNNVLFVWANKGEIVGCTEQGTRKYLDSKKDKMRSWKKIHSNSKENDGFTITVGDPKNIYFYESEIDMLSYMTLKPDKINNAKFVSMNGLKKETLATVLMENYKETGAIPESITVCVDNDKGGLKFIEDEVVGKKFGNFDNYVELKSDLPAVKGHDWNDTLVEKSKPMIQNISKDQVLNIMNRSKKEISRSTEFEMA